MGNRSPKTKIGVAVALAVAIAAPAEGLRQTAYKDPVGILTVCYGYTGSDIKTNVTYTKEQCRALLDSEMLLAIDTVDRCVPGLPVEVLAAFGDAVYNMGPKIACDTRASTAARLLRAGKIADACEQLPRWDKAIIGGVPVTLPGLTKRRLVEKELCLEGAQS